MNKIDENLVKEKYVSKMKIKAKKIKLIDALEEKRYKGRTGRRLLIFGISLLSDLLEEDN